MLASDEFRTRNLGHNFVLTNCFMLDAEEPDWWILFDPDMEAAESQKI